MSKLTGYAVVRRKEGRENLRRVREFLLRHPGAKQVDIAKALGLSTMAVSRHVRVIRDSWSKAHD